MGFADRFQSYLDELRDSLGGHQRRQEHFCSYCSALSLPLERKSVEPLAASVDPENVQARHQSLHNFVSSASWSDRAVLDQVTHTVAAAFDADEQLHWLIDDTGIPKKGRHSVGVAHQYCGQLGKQANCQVAVSLSIACESASLPIDYRLYVPKDWAEDEQRRAQVGVPDEVRFQTKPQIALEQIRAAVDRGVEPGIVGADAGYGHDSGFRDALDELGLQYIVGIQPTTHVKRTAKGKASGKSSSAEALAHTLDRRSFRHVTWREGSNTPLHSWFARVRVRATTGEKKRGATARAEQWLLIEWPPGLTTPTKYFLSTLPASTPLERLVCCAKMRWRIERDYQVLKQEVGLNHFEGRSWTGFHHHATLCIATYGFLILERLRHSGREKNEHRPKSAGLPQHYIPRGTPSKAEAC